MSRCPLSRRLTSYLIRATDKRQHPSQRRLFSFSFSFSFFFSFSSFFFFFPLGTFPLFPRYRHSPSSSFLPFFLSFSLSSLLVFNSAFCGPDHGVLRKRSQQGTPRRLRRLLRILNPPPGRGVFVAWRRWRSLGDACETAAAEGGGDRR